MLPLNWHKPLQICGLMALALFVLSCLYTCGYVIGKQSGRFDVQAGEYAAQYQEDMRKRVAQCSRTNASPRDADVCVNEINETFRENQRGERDLQAQQEMSKWAFWLLVISIGQTIVGSAGFFAVLATLTQGREANEISRETAIHDKRAWLDVMAVLPKDSSVEWEDDILYIPIDIDVKNYGDSPALRVSAGAQGFKTVDEALAGVKAISDWKYPHHPVTVFPNESTSTPIHWLAACEVEGRGFAHPIVIVYATYKTVFDAVDDFRVSLRVFAAISDKNNAIMKSSCPLSVTEINLQPIREYDGLFT